MGPIDYVYIGFFGVMIFSTTLWLLVYITNREEVYVDPEPSRYPGVTFLVPAYNEEEHVGETIEHLLDLDYPGEKLHVIAIDDGSTDSTLEVLREYADDIEIIDKENSGKANSLNVALEQVETELVAVMDADSWPEPDLLQRTVGKFEDDEVLGVTPALKIRDPSNAIEKIQWAEYIYQIFLRKMFAIFDTQFVLPGPGSIYRTEYMKETGGWNEDTFTEDMEIAFRMTSDEGRIENSSNAYVDTDPPSTLRALFRQRIRWYRGYIENFIDYRHLLGRSRYGNLGVFILPFNVVWTGLVVFFFLHFLYNAALGLRGLAWTYMLTGTVPLDLGLTIQDLNLFHIFMTYFALTGLGTILISLKVSGEDVMPWQRKTHYLMFLLVYPSLFAAFWIAAILEHLGMGDRRW